MYFLDCVLYMIIIISMQSCFLKNESETMHAVLVYQVCNHHNLLLGNIRIRVRAYTQVLNLTLYYSHEVQHQSHLQYCNNIKSMFIIIILLLLM